jgi:integrase/recombinase XerD
MNRHVLGSHSDGLITVLVRRYREHLVVRRFARKTVEIYGMAMERFADFLSGRGITRAQEVTQTDIEAYRRLIVERQWRQASIEVYLRAIKKFFRWLEDTQVIFLNPAEGIVIRQAPRPLMSVPSEEEILRLLAVPNTATFVGLRDRAMLETAYATGMRAEELSRLTVKDVDLGNGTVRVMGKGSRERMVPLGAAAAEWLRKYLASTAQPAPGKPAPLWVVRGGTALSYGGLRLNILRHSRACGVTPLITPHALRRACATHMLRRGAHPVDLQMLLGHTTLKHLTQYLRLTIHELQAVHALSKPGA